MYSMKAVCQQTGLSYETLKFYCNQGLVPNVKRDRNRRRIFDEDDIAWINSLRHLRNCEMSIKDMKRFLALCQEGPSSIPSRQKILEAQKMTLLKRIADLQKAVAYIDQKQQYYEQISQ